MTNTSSFLGSEPIHKLMVKLSAPAVTAMIATGLYTALSTIIIARGIDMDAVGAAGLVFTIQALYQGLAQMVSIGAASAISRSLGKDDSEYANLVVGNSLSLTLAISILLMLLTFFFAKPMLNFFGSTEELMEPANEFLSILTWSIPFNAFFLNFVAFFRAEGNLKRSMMIIILDCGVNLLLDYLFIVQFGWGFSGAGWAMFGAHLLSSLFGFSFFFRKKTLLELHAKNFLPRLKPLVAIISVGFSAFARNGAVTVFSLIMNNRLRAMDGTDALVAFGAANRIVQFFFLPIMGFNQGFQPIASYNYGAGKQERVREGLKYVLIYTTLIGVIASLTGILIPKPILGLFTDDQVAISEGATVLRLQLLFFWTMGFQTVASNFYQALGRPLQALLLSIFKHLALLSPLVYLLTLFDNLPKIGIWFAFPIAEGIAFIIVLIVLRRQYKILKEDEKPSQKRYN